MSNATVATDLLRFAEERRVALSGLLEEGGQRSQHGQFFTPSEAAQLIASLPRLDRPVIRMLDPGAGSGMLSAAVAARCLTEIEGVQLQIVAVESAPEVVPTLRETLTACQEAAGAVGASLSFEVVDDDFISRWSEPQADNSFDLAVLNPPYRKLAASSTHRQMLKAQGIDAPNLYAAFLALSARALKPRGQLVAITPRSFCNGPYFAQFRSRFLEDIALDRIHVFESRSTVFRDTAVLQENVIFSGTRGGEREEVILSVSRGHQDDPLQLRRVDYAEVVHPGDKHQFIRLAASDEDTAVAEQMMQLPATLTDLGITASTGRVVDFRSRECLLGEAREGAFPLVYPGNLRNGVISWPREIRKAQWFAPVTPKDDAMLLPQGWYCVVKRFSAKEERRRVVAALWDPQVHEGPVALENHVNVFHVAGAGLEPLVATGLVLWLNSSLVDRFFRTFSGHTQVNATDLRSLRYPNLEMLRRLGESGKDLSTLGQEQVDALVGAVLERQAAA